MSRSTPTKCVMRPVESRRAVIVHAAGNDEPSFRRPSSVPRQMLLAITSAGNVAPDVIQPGLDEIDEVQRRELLARVAEGAQERRIRVFERPSGRVIRIRSPVCSVAAARSCSRASARCSSDPLPRQPQRHDAQPDDRRDAGQEEPDRIDGLAAPIRG